MIDIIHYLAVCIGYTFIFLCTTLFFVCACAGVMKEISRRYLSANDVFRAVELLMEEKKRQKEPRSER